MPDNRFGFNPEQVVRKWAEKEKERRSELIGDLGKLADRFQKLGGNPAFLRYALTGAILTDPPEHDIEEINAFLKERVDPDHLLSTGQDAAVLIRKLEKIPGLNRERDEVLEALAALRSLLKWIDSSELEDFLLSRPRGHQSRTAAWRYSFFPSVWCHLSVVSEAALSTRWLWMQDAFVLGDSIKVIDKNFVRGRLRSGGLRFADFTKPAFRVFPQGNPGNWETARSWFYGAIKTKDSSLHSHFVAGTDKFLVWRHKLYLPRKNYETSRAVFTRGDRLYAQAAWAMLRDDMGYEQVPSPPAVVLSRCLDSAKQ